jgi:hypothetical protein
MSVPRFIALSIGRGRTWVLTRVRACKRSEREPLRTKAELELNVEEIVSGEGGGRATT